MALGSGEIRLLDILPYDDGDAQAPVCCELRVADLRDEPVYEVLSYRWGDPGHRTSVTVNGTETPVTPNLHAALLRLRRPEGEEGRRRTIWIDQLCIDQGNAEERIAQVRLMRDIFSRCTRCVIWLDDVDPAAVPRAADAEAIVSVLRWMGGTQHDDADPNPPPSPPACLASPAAFHGPIRALASIGPDAHPWWDRIWTVQEAILPSRKVLLWGALSIPWDALTAAARAWTSSTAFPAALETLLRQYGGARGEVTRTTVTVMTHLFCNVKWVDLAHRRREPPVMSAMKWRWRKATVPSDNVFGLLGLLPPEMRLAHTGRCGYDTPAAELFGAFTLDVILSDDGGGGLIILALAPRAPEGEGTKGVARWTYDMDCPLIPYEVDQFYRYWGYKSYDACAGRELDGEALERENHAGSRLILGLTGVMVDTISLVGSSILQRRDPDQVEFVEAKRISQTMRSWMSMAREYHKSLEGGLVASQFEEAFYRTMVHDRVRNHEQWVVRRPNEQDLASISEFVRTGCGLINDLNFWAKYVCNQTFFVTRNGVMGFGHLETRPGDQVWVFDGGRMPFTVSPRDEDSRDDFDFVGCCYAHGHMDGEIYGSGQHDMPLRTIRLH